MHLVIIIRVVLLIHCLVLKYRTCLVELVQEVKE
nr:MAG TPA: hypothetical protein [Caudoviricetes sp.]